MTENKASGILSDINVEDIRLIVFDVDGTLAETDDFFIDKGSVILCRLLPFVKAEKIERFFRSFVMVGETALHGCYRLLDMVGLDTVISKAHSKMSVRGDYRYDQVKGAYDTVERLSRSYKLGIITSGGYRSTQAFMEKTGITDMISYVISAEDCRFIKPHPLPLKKMAEKAGIPIERCLMVGDSVFDILCAKRAGARCAAVKTGFDMEFFLRWHHPDMLLDSVNDLPGIIMQNQENDNSAGKKKDLV